MKLKISISRTLVTFLVASLIAAGLIFGMCFSFFLKWPWEWQPYVIISLWLVSSIFFLVLTIKLNYYELTRKEVIVHRFKKQLIYRFSDVIYIDEEKSLKKKTVYFYTKFGHDRYLTFDREGLLYKAMLEKCTNRLTKEEFNKRYPNLK